MCWGRPLDPDSRPGPAAPGLPEHRQFRRQRRRLKKSEQLPGPICYGSSLNPPERILVFSRRPRLPVPKSRVGSLIAETRLVGGLVRHFGSRTSPASKRIMEMESVGRKLPIDFAAIANFHRQFAFRVGIVEVGDCLGNGEEAMHVVRVGKHRAGYFPGGGAVPGY